MTYAGRLLLLLASSLYSSTVSTQTCTGVGTRNITVEDCTATSSPIAEAVLIYPNPATGYFAVKNSTEAIHFELFNLSGLLILKKLLPPQTMTLFETEHIPAGFYLAFWYAERSQKISTARIEILR